MNLKSKLLIILGVVALFGVIVLYVQEFRWFQNYLNPRKMVLGSLLMGLVLDYNQPGYFSTETVEKIRQTSPLSKLLIISGDGDKKTIYQVLESGVNSYLSKNCGEKEIVDAVEATANNEKFYCTNVLNHLLEKSFPKEADCAPTPLSAREIEIVRLVASGLIAKEIAWKLNLSTHTVYTHRKNIMKKLKLGTTSELVLFAVNERLV